MISYLTTLILDAPCPLGAFHSGSLSNKNWLRSPFSMYSTIIHSGSSSVQAASSLTMLGSRNWDIIFISFMKSVLWKTRQNNWDLDLSNNFTLLGKILQKCNYYAALIYIEVENYHGQHSNYLEYRHYKIKHYVMTCYLFCFWLVFKDNTILQK